MRKNKIVLSLCYFDTEPSGVHAVTVPTIGALRTNLTFNTASSSLIPCSVSVLRFKRQFWDTSACIEVINTEVQVTSRMLTSTYRGDHYFLFSTIPSLSLKPMLMQTAPYVCMHYLKMIQCRCIFLW